MKKNRKSTKKVTRTVTVRWEPCLLNHLPSPGFVYDYYPVDIETPETERCIHVEGRWIPLNRVSLP